MRSVGETCLCQVGSVWETLHVTFFAWIGYDSVIKFTVFAWVFENALSAWRTL